MLHAVGRQDDRDAAKYHDGMEMMMAMLGGIGGVCKNPIASVAQQLMDMDVIFSETTNGIMSSRYSSTGLWSESLLPHTITSF
jgi:hypothetical protein